MVIEILTQRTEQRGNSNDSGLSPGSLVTQPNGELFPGDRMYLFHMWSRRDGPGEGPEEKATPL